MVSNRKLKEFGVSRASNCSWLLSFSTFQPCAHFNIFPASSHRYFVVPISDHSTTAQRHLSNAQADVPNEVKRALHLPSPSRDGVLRVECRRHRLRHQPRRKTHQVRQRRWRLTVTLSRARVRASGSFTGSTWNIRAGSLAWPGPGDRRTQICCLLVWRYFEALLWEDTAVWG